jgi:hypothetical protein
MVDDLELEKEKVIMGRRAAWRNVSTTLCNNFFHFLSTIALPSLENLQAPEKATWILGTDRCYNADFNANWDLTSTQRPHLYSNSGIKSADTLVENNIFFTSWRRLVWLFWNSIYIKSTSVTLWIKHRSFL